MFDTDKFIQYVQNNPSIWEMGSKEYMDRNVKIQSWNSVGDGMYEDWDALTDNEKEKKVKDMKKRWRHIRDSYAKFLTHGKSGHAPKKKKYVYSDSLTFLQHTIKKRITTCNFDDKDAVDNPVPEENENETIERDIELEEDTAGPSTASVRRKTGSGKKGVTPFQSRLLTYLEVQASRNDTEDADKAFLLSLLPDYKKLTYDQKTDFRLHTLQFFKNISQAKNLMQQQTFTYPAHRNNFVQPHTPQSNHITSPYNYMAFPGNASYSTQSFQSRSSLDMMISDNGCSPSPLTQYSSCEHSYQSESNN